MSTSNPYAAPKATVADLNESPTPDVIAGLDVSPNWKLKFTIIAKAGGPKLPLMKSLSGSERRKISFNFWAWFFGPFYYLSKGMWRKALAIGGLVILGSLIVSVILEMIKPGMSNAVGIAGGVVFAVRANIDFYKKKVLGIDGWI